PKIVPLHDLTGILRLLLKERVPVSDLRRILEVLPPLTARNLSIEETAEALRPELASLLIQQIAPLNTPLPVITFDGELENMLINMQRQSPEGELILDTELAQRILENLTRVNEQLSAEGRQAVVVVSPVIRRSMARIIRQHIDDMVVIAFSELPETRKVDVVATIGSETDPTTDPNIA
ncbi:MAG: FHIPEP family type III secretion protein, partial [Parvibaculales bacterium]